MLAPTVPPYQSTFVKSFSNVAGEWAAASQLPVLSFPARGVVPRSGAARMEELRFNDSGELT